MREVNVFLSIIFLAACSSAQDTQTEQNVQVAQDTVELSMQNHDQVLNSSQVVFVAFCADWCPFSRRLKPIFEESARVFKRENPNASVVWAIVDSVRQADVGDKYYVNKYPTMKVFVNGELIQKEYRSTRSVEALTSFVKYQLSTAINEFASQDQLTAAMDPSKRNVVAWVKRGTEDYANLKKVASLLREECTFWVADEALSATVTENKLSYYDQDSKDEQKFTGNLRDYDFLKQWVTDKCIPLVREVTFENVEELTEEGLPFLLFFRDPKQKDQDKMFTEQVIRELPDQRASINPLLADGHKFAHPLKHLGKTAKDLPVLAIDSFQHMYVFPDMSQLTVPGKLREFVMDLHSGKLHKEFHETLDQKMIDLAKFKAENGITDEDLDDNRETGGMPAARPEDTTPPPSVFKKLKPSEKRYSLLQKTEFKLSALSAFLRPEYNKLQFPCSLILKPGHFSDRNFLVLLLHRLIYGLLIYCVGVTFRHNVVVKGLKNTGQTFESTEPTEQCPRAVAHTHCRQVSVPLHPCRAGSKTNRRLTARNLTLWPFYRGDTHLSAVSVGIVPLARWTRRSVQCSAGVLSSTFDNDVVSKR
ncbi:hypothetical protein Y032_0279g1210 [Ancylostoma ceylanicum]|uniref:Thioredoxin domain-containing protein n=1 Tax=Ancylostoma ceylanicum TaxID=53326 RepID=A0A016S7X2_9BILA|nr:hypothetical protein Y032_0279g1210 [Ancylostoma ceylanicum]